jgi:hypothetical protein
MASLVAKQPGTTFMRYQEDDLYGLYTREYKYLFTTSVADDEELEEIVEYSKEFAHEIWEACEGLLPGRLTGYWMYEGEIYRSRDYELTGEQVRALILEERMKRDRTIERAMNVVNATTTPKAKRESIPNDVKLLVWNRDGARCVECGSAEKLEYDHVIPLSRGGSNTARNLQLLCEGCNRSKGSHIA